MAGLGRWDALVSPLGHAATAWHRKAFQIDVGGVGPALGAGFGVNRENPVKRCAEIQMVVYENGRSLPR